MYSEVNNGMPHFISVGNVVFSGVLLCSFQILMPIAPPLPPPQLNLPATATSQMKAQTQSFHLAPSPPRPSPSLTSPTGKGNSCPP